MTYEDAINFLFNKTLIFQHVGAPAYKPGLETTLEISEIFGNPEKTYKTIHIAGTNGKGSTAHTLAAILQNNGYKVGLYTSPHLIDFRERIRVNGEMIGKEFVTDFLDKFLNSGYNGRKPSFFELTTILAFNYFKLQKVDYAVIETGLGGRLDSTNIINPILSIITNISFDHTQFLGNTLAKIASEKAGIIKPNTPVIIGESDVETTPVFAEKAQNTKSKIIFAEQCNEILSVKKQSEYLVLDTKTFGTIEDELTGDCQIKNANTILNAVNELRASGIRISDDSVRAGFKNVSEQTGLKGRWMKLSDSPLTICDTGHNTGGMQYISRQLKAIDCRKLHIVIGFVSDKDVSHILDMLPKDAEYYFTQASLPRAMQCEKLKVIASEKGLNGNTYKSVKEAYNAAKSSASTDDMIYIGGSTFIVADLLECLDNKRN